MAIHCPKCGAENPDSAGYCNLCLEKIVFEEDEFPMPAPRDEGYMTRYPSSFAPDAPVVEKDASEDPQPDATPVDVGEYGVKTGQEVDETPKPKKVRLPRGSKPPPWGSNQ